MKRRRRPSAAARLTVLLLALSIFAGCNTGQATPSPAIASAGPTTPSSGQGSAGPSATAAATPTVVPTATPTPSAPPSASAAPASATPAPSAPSSPAATATPAPSAAGAIDWQPCPENLAVECGTLAVPLDEVNPGPETIEIALVRLPATGPGERIGSLLANPGGPGASGVDFVRDNGSAIFSADLLARFDLIGFDPRGVGSSTAIRCVDDNELDRLNSLDPTPDTPAERQLLIDGAMNFAASCGRNSGSLLPFMTTEHAARDMDRIREAVGDDKLTYLGFSYGTFLGATYARLFPDRVRALVLDGAVDATQGFESSMRTQAQGFSDALDAFFTDCEERVICLFNGGRNVRQAFDTLMDKIDAQPLPATAIGDPRPVGPGEATTGVLSALYSAESWPILVQGLELARKGDGSLLLLLADSYNQRDPNGRYQNIAAANNAVNCADYVVPTDIAFYDDLGPDLEQIAPRFGRMIAYTGLTCAFWPLHPTSDPPVPTAEGAPPIVVVGTTGDPATPYEWAVKLADQLASGVLLTYEGEGHTAYASGSSCIVDAVDRYLIELTPPADGTRC